MAYILRGNEVMMTSVTSTRVFNSSYFESDANGPK